MQKKVHYFLSHPIQYQSPLLRKLSKKREIDLQVYYFTKHTLDGLDKQFGIKINWDIPLLEGYNFKFLKNISPKPAVSGAFWGLINQGVFLELILNRPNYIIVHGWAYFSNFLLLIVAKLLGIKVIMRAESPWKQEYQSKVKQLILKRFVNKALYLGNQNRLFYEQYGLEDAQLFFAPYCVDNDRFSFEYTKLLPIRERNRSLLGYLESDVVVLFTGKLIPKKRPLDLLKAIDTLHIINLKVIMVGEGELRSEIEAFMAEKELKNITLRGFVNQTEISTFYSIADIFVLPSGRGETWGLVVNEAMNFHLPIIASDMVGCTDDLIMEGINGYTYPCSDVTALSYKLRQLVGNESLRKQMGEASAQIVSEYSYDNCVKGIMEALE